MKSNKNKHESWSYTEAMISRFIFLMASLQDCVGEYFKKGVKKLIIAMHQSYRIYNQIHKYRFMAHGVQYRQ